MHFQTTRWTLILQAADTRSEVGVASLDKLCRDYWPPLYAYVRSFGKSHEDAQDLTQAFFQRLLQAKFQSSVDRERGRFRTYLLKLLKHFIINEHRSATAQKRGGQERETVDVVDVEAELMDDSTPEKAYEHKWAHTVLANTLERLRQDCEERGQGDRFRVLQPLIFEDARNEGIRQEHADTLGITLNAARVTLTRLRQRYRELLRVEVGRLVDDPTEIDDELAHLMRVLS